MAVNVKFGTFSGEKEEVHKEVTWQNNGTPVSCQLVNTSLTDPILKVEESRKGFNYVEITTFGRKYFVGEPESIVGGHVLLHCHVDVLSTYETGIKELNCLVLRNEDINKWKRDITDSAIPATNKRSIYGRNFGSNTLNVGLADSFVVGIISG